MCSNVKYVIFTPKPKNLFGDRASYTPGAHREAYSAPQIL